MSQNEKLQQEALAHRALKDAKSKAAVLKVSLSESARSLQDVIALLSNFVNNPTQKSSSGIPLSEHLKTQIESLRSQEDLTRMVDDLAAQVIRSAELETQISNF